MLKVLIADDEKKVCRLIQMLCDWEQLNMELVGTAENGLQALEMLEQYRPDILITDICMPGCDGLDVIRRAREMDMNLEVIIISGYTDFKYAQTAIRYGVVEYLLKPIRKDELNASLKKLGERCLKEKERSDSNARLLQYMESDVQRRRYSLFLDRILQKPSEELSLETINEKYSYQFIPEAFRILILKLDTVNKRITPQALARVASAMHERLRQGVTEVCQELEIYEAGSISYILCNYKVDKSFAFQQALRKVADFINMKRFQLGDVRYTIALGNPLKEYNQLDICQQSALEAMRERLVEGCDKMLDVPRHRSSVSYSERISAFNRSYDSALELMDEALVESQLVQMQELLSADKDITGQELLNVVSSIGIHAITVGNAAGKREAVSDFHKMIEDCCSVEMLFAVLRDALCGMVREKKEQHQDEDRKPVRLAKQYLMNHYMELVTLDIVADYVGFNSSYFSVIFKKETGIGFGDYLTALRVEKAKELLKSSKDAVKDICIQVGYRDLKHFNAVFKKSTGLKPGEYRKLYG